MNDKNQTIQDLENQIEYLETFIAELTADDEAGEWCLRARDIEYTRVFPQTYIYKMEDRASHDICFLGGYHQDWLNDDATDKYKYLVEYYRPLTDEELAEYDLHPYSDTTPDIYIYGMPRPPMYATCPIDFKTLTYDQAPDNAISADFYPFLASYETPLSDEEQKKWEMRPVSPNAYRWQVGDIIQGKYPLKIARQLINWNYECEYVLPEDHAMYGKAPTQRFNKWELLEKLNR